MKEYKEDLIREFELKEKACNSYFDFMYKTVQFTFAAIIAIIVVIAQLFNSENGNLEEIKAILLAYVLPICIYVFGVMYAYNAYSLMITGNSAEKLHKEIIKTKYTNKSSSKITTMFDFDNYILSKRFFSTISYGVQLMFYIAFPIASIILSIMLCNTTDCAFFYKCLPFILVSLYYTILIIIIVNICKEVKK